MKVQAKVDPKRVDGFLAGLRYVSSIPFVRKAFGIAKIKLELLEYLRNIFPKSDPRWQHASHLITGFRTYDIPEREGTIGFVLQHSGASNIRTRTILQSLEKGSRGYYRYPEVVFNDAGEGRFAFIPGLNRGIRHGPGPGDFAMAKRLHIPARSGEHYMARTLDFARELILQAKPEYFKQVKEAIRRKKTN